MGGEWDFAFCAFEEFGDAAVVDVRVAGGDTLPATGFGVLDFVVGGV